MSTVLWIVAVPLILLGEIFLWQDRLLYYPQKASVAQLAVGGLQPWPSAQDFRGLVAEPATARGTAIIFHGNAGHAGHRGFYAQALVPLGWRVILAEYPSYGPRPGRSGQRALVDDAEKTIAWAHATHGGPLLVIGESLGSAVAAAAGARRHELIAGLLLITPWDRLVNVGAHNYPLLPVRWMLRDRYETLVALRGFDRPVVVAVAEGDGIVPPRFGRALHAGLGAASQLVVVRGADHNDWPDRVDAEWWRAVTEAASGGA